MLSCRRYSLDVRSVSSPTSQPRCRSRGLGLICGGWLCLVTSILPAQDVGPGSLSLVPRWDTVRTHAPRYFEAHLQWPLRTLLEGELELECFVGPELQCRYTSYETALSENGMTLSVVVPPPVLNRETDNYVVRAHFRGTDRTIYLDEHFAVAPVRWKRTSVIGMIEDRSGSVPAGMVETNGDASDFFRSLQLEEFMPRPGRSRGTSSVWSMSPEQELSLLRGWQQVVTNVPPADVPTDPLQLLAFDILMASSEQLGKLSPGQRDALRLWTQGGGSLAVSITGKVSKSLEHWLNQIAGGRREQPTVSVGSLGEVTLLQESTDVLHAYPGVGRSVLVMSPPEVESRDWQQAMFHLWKLRSSQQDSIQRRGRFQFDVDQDWTRHDSYEPLPWDVTFDANATTLTSLLLPESVQGVPLWLVCSVLAGCLLVVVPGDYFLLGHFRLQRWTWLTVPLIALISSWFMIDTANSYMGSRDFVQTLTYVDLNADGEPVRSSQFQLSFPATSRDVTREYQETFEVDLGEGRSAQSALADDPVGAFERSGIGLQNVQERLAGAGTPALVAPADVTEYFGTVPSLYSLRRHVNQWTPRVSRITRFGLLSGLPDAAPSEIRELQWTDQGKLDRETVVAELAQAHPESVVLCWQRGEWSMHLPSEATDRLKSIAEHVAGQTHRDDRGMFHIVAQVSPQGGPLTEDLALDTQQLVVVLLQAEAEGSQFIAWRRLVASH